MKSIELLEQAKLADKLGKYKLADNYYLKAVRLAAAPPFVEIEPALREAMDAALRAAIENGDEAAIIKALRDRGFTEEGIKILEKTGKLKGITITNVNTLVGGASSPASRLRGSIRLPDGSHVSLSGMNLFELLSLLRTPELHVEERRRLINAIRNFLKKPQNAEQVIDDEFAEEIGREFTRPRPRPRPTPGPEPTPEPTPEPPITEVIPEEGEGLFSKLFRKKPKNVETELPKQKSKLIKWAKGLTVAALATYGLILVGDKLYHKDSKKEINYLDPDWNRLGLPDFRMYNDRMEAGQQKAQEPKALAFIEKHKDNPAIKDQRDWYNLALQEGKKEGDDPKTVKNFANDVIAIIKKSPLTQGFNADRNAPRS